MRPGWAPRARPLNISATACAPQVKPGTYLAEGLGGYAVFEAENIEAAIALAARIPAARLGGAVEVRPAEKYW